MSRFQVLKDLALANKAFYNNDTVDKLFQAIYKVGSQQIQSDSRIHLEFESLLWDNFDCIKRSLVLLPKLSVHAFMKDQVKASIKEAF